MDHRRRTPCYLCKLNIFIITIQCNAYSIYFNSKTKFDKRLENIKRKRQIDINISDKDESSEEDDEKELKMRTIYKEYMTEVVSALVFFANPDVDLTVVVDAVEQVALKVMKFDNAIYEVSNNLVSYK